MSGEFTFSDCKCGARDERILIERCTATWRILGDVYVVYCTECGEAEPFVSMDRNDASALNARAIRAWNTRHGAGDADRSAELTTAWMAGAESVRDQAARDGDAWRPIESAPTKGRVMLYDADRIPSILIAHWRHGAWWGDMTNSGRSIVWRDATHWRPLPAPPTEEAARAGERG